MKKIEVRKKERDRKTQDLQKLISQADQQSENAVNNNASSSSNRKQDRKITKKRVQPPSRPSRTDPTVNKSLCHHYKYTQCIDLTFKYFNIIFKIKLIFQKL